MDIDTWLHEVGLARYAELFRSNDIDHRVLRQLTGDDLKELGIASLGHRKKLLAAIAALNAVPQTLSSNSATPAPSSTAERRQLTVMFVDLVGSTALSTRFDPEDMRELIRPYQNTVASEISRFGGHVAQFLGDGVLAYFGWPRAHEDDAKQAVRAALAVTAATSRLTTSGTKNLQTRIGIATGIVVVGDLIAEGATQRHAVVGETPNLAARLQCIAEPGTIIIAEMTRHVAGELFVLRELGTRNFKGMEKPIAVYCVLAERTLDSRFAASQSGRLTPIVGRDQELALLLERWRQAKSGEGQVVLLSGEAGIGKSRLTQALVEVAAKEPHFL
ncbi:MAG: adenylate/guanylate cyclase domain-containing protein, partial [Methylococcales bacterium]